MNPRLPTKFGPGLYRTGVNHVIPLLMKGAMSPTPLWEDIPKGCLELVMSEPLVRTPPRDNGIGLSQLGSRALHIALDACWS